MKKALTKVAAALLIGSVALVGITACDSPAKDTRGGCEKALNAAVDRYLKTGEDQTGGSDSWRPDGCKGLSKQVFRDAQDKVAVDRLDDLLNSPYTWQDGD